MAQPIMRIVKYKARVDRHCIKPEIACAKNLPPRVRVTPHRKRVPRSYCNPAYSNTYIIFFGSLETSQLTLLQLIFFLDRLKLLS